MNEDDNITRAIIPDPGWEKAKPEKLPEPAYWPFFLATGVAFIFWGLLTTWVILAAGFLIFIISLTGWINLMRHE